MVFSLDIVLSICWGLLVLLGLALQLHSSASRAPFPPPSSCSHPHRSSSRRRSRRHHQDRPHTCSRSNSRESTQSGNHRTRRFRPVPLLAEPTVVVVDERSPLISGQQYRFQRSDPPVDPPSNYYQHNFNSNACYPPPDARRNYESI